MDLHTRLERFGGPIEAAAADTIAADVERGQRALRRRRTFRTSAVTAFGMAAIVATISVTGAVTGTAPSGPAVAASLPAAAGSTPAARVKLVDYTGAQPKWFTIDKVPEGYFVQKDDEGGLTIAPASVKNPPPGADPSKDPRYDPSVLTDKIGIYLEPTWYREGNDDGEKVTVGGFPAVLHGAAPLQQLMILVSPKVYATVQADVPLTRDQLLELGAGLHVSKEAVDRMAASTGKTGKTGK
ncbi:hypothetical protein ACWT_7031 [Actinoplanes sp. SE50]|uniref:hypothetical protein n=1 Tax=unclassified Actinoplanes TaxID=2626549 RepID=UPI00023EC527|nr:MULTISPECIES: hypothetical protein [unclassified Actinoplanes]AEV88042.1 hypothetical protein ACPL_7162 [Actinoplanes sp. SE50/110]ATO86446.1 hypothetical protein ACWT_7031 [Actinoplanes sp. SE50]SLM03861.1 hypothetical protein ACSP50_7160 [Actinoplanes sp. SE50/110]